MAWPCRIGHNAIGIRGNSHMMMQDRNNVEIAEVIQQWLVSKGLVE